MHELDLHASNPVHAGATTARWTTVNSGEAFPGVLKPLTYTFYYPGVERSVVRNWKALGLLPSRRPEVAESLDDRFFCALFGRMVISVDSYAKLADVTPGSSAAAVEEHMFGIKRSHGEDTHTWRRYPFVAIKAPATIMKGVREVRANVERIPRWRRQWLQSLASGDKATARKAFVDARERQEPVLSRHVMFTAVTQALYEVTASLCAKAGYPGAELDLLKSRDGAAEVHLVSALYKVANGQRSMEAFLADYGYQGNGNAHLDTIVWRQNPKALESLLERYRSEGSLEAKQQELGERSVALISKVLAGLPLLQRPIARFLLNKAAEMPVLREAGKTLFQQVADVGREASLVLGRCLVAEGQLNEVDDVYFCTAEELLSGTVPDAATVQHRRDLYAAYCAIDLPILLQGKPELSKVDASRQMRAAEGEVIHGLGACSGLVRGRARVVEDPDEIDLDDGDIIVCRTSDPSWSAAFAVAAGAIVDIGGPISHGAIVCRELGIPCVIATGNAMELLRDGDEVVLDGSKGTVRLEVSAENRAIRLERNKIA